MAFDRDLEATLRGRLAGTALQIIEDTLDVLESRVDESVNRKLRTGEALTSDDGARGWYMKFAISELRDTLRKLSQSGRAASARITPTMNQES